MPFQPLASQMKLGAAAQATSRTLFAEKRQVSVAPLGDDGHRRIGAQRSRESLALGCRQHLERIREPSGPGDDESPRDRDREIDVAVLEVELALAEVLFRIPAAHVVVDCEARIPLGDLIQPPLCELFASHAIGAVLRHLERVADLERRDASRRKRAAQIDAHRGAVLRRPQ